MFQWFIFNEIKKIHLEIGFKNFEFFFDITKVKVQYRTKVIDLYKKKNLNCLSFISKNLRKQRQIDKKE
jgi:hypothetical protein